MNTSEAETERTRYILLECLVNNGDVTWPVHKMYQPMLAELKQLNAEDQKELLEQLAEFAPKKVSASARNRKFERLIDPHLTGILYPSGP